LNGNYIPVAQACVPVYDAGFVLGATVTDQVRTFHHKPFRLGEHLDRLLHSLDAAGINIGLSKCELGEIAHKLLSQHARVIHDEDELGLVFFATPGEYRTYAPTDALVRTTPTICAHTFLLPFELWAERIQNGVHLVTPSVRQVPPQCVDPAIKCRSRMHFYLADLQARQVDPAATALLLDMNGYITETSTANFLMVERGTIVSPKCTNTLAGVSRATAIELAGELNIPVAECDISVEAAMRADEAFLASTPYCLMPISRINGVLIAGGNQGPVYQKLMRAWSNLVGLDIARQLLEGTRRRNAFS
jgi:branched-subunit amino acid aminotransferase/4-amino-4-deoxychorismate lyase